MDLSRRYLLASGPALAAGLALASKAEAAKLGLDPQSDRDQSEELQAALDKAAARGGALFLPAGRYRASGLRLEQPLHLSGVPGATILVAAKPGPVLALSNAPQVTLSGLSFDGAGLDGDGTSRSALLAAAGCQGLVISSCSFSGSKASGVTLIECAGRIIDSHLSDFGKVGLFALDSKGLEIAGNHLRDIGNNAIQVWTSDRREDGTLIIGNRIERVAANDGGDGQNGNGINIFRGSGVTVANNRITDCAFSAIRDNSGDNITIANNNCARITETAIFVEFAFSGAVVTGNMLENVSAGISITNYNEGGRLAVCANNVVRDVKGGGPNPNGRAIGIGVEADTVVNGNVIENSAEIGLAIGWGHYLRNINAGGNIIRNCPIGIAVSAVQGAQSALIANNLISGATQGAIFGMNHAEPATGDLALKPDEIPPHLVLRNNLIS
ncbi:MAG: TIGR03808 family TAT-translocated repetitive protein [Hyphomicrobiales bacterium]